MKNLSHLNEKGFLTQTDKIIIIEEAINVLQEMADTLKVQTIIHKHIDEFNDNRICSMCWLFVSILRLNIYTEIFSKIPELLQLKPKSCGNIYWFPSIRASESGYILNIEFSVIPRIKFLKTVLEYLNEQ